MLQHSNKRPISDAHAIMMLRPERDVRRERTGWEQQEFPVLTDQVLHWTRSRRVTPARVT
jgi:hypothetical protein